MIDGRRTAWLMFLCAACSAGADNGGSSNGGAGSGAGASGGTVGGGGATGSGGVQSGWTCIETPECNCCSCGFGPLGSGGAATCSKSYPCCAKLGGNQCMCPTTSGLKCDAIIEGLKKTWPDAEQVASCPGGGTPATGGGGAGGVAGDGGAPAGGGTGGAGGYGGVSTGGGGAPSGGGTPSGGSGGTGTGGSGGGGTGGTGPGGNGGTSSGGTSPCGSGGSVACAKPCNPSDPGAQFYCTTYCNSIGKGQGLCGTVSGCSCCFCPT